MSVRDFFPLQAFPFVFRGRLLSGFQPGESSDIEKQFKIIMVMFNIYQRITVRDTLF